MPDMRKHPSGAILFHLTPQEREVYDLKQTLQKELDEIRKLKEELQKMTEKE